MDQTLSDFLGEEVDTINPDLVSVIISKAGENWYNILNNIINQVLTSVRE